MTMLLKSDEMGTRGNVGRRVLMITDVGPRGFLGVMDLCAFWV
ncbi:MAG: hypothetical protein QMB94_00570 [Phycisphaerales bacterium]